MELVSLKYPPRRRHSNTSGDLADFSVFLGPSYSENIPGKCEFLSEDTLLIC